MSEKVMNAGLFGFGTIGAGVARLLKDNKDVVKTKTGTTINLKRIVDIDTTTDRGVDFAPATLTSKKEDILDDADISVVIELIGGAGIAKTIVTEALEKGKHVVTANKELIAKHGPELMALADSKGVCLLFEASVGGGIPALTPLLTCLRGNRITRVLGIVNGTTNFILTKMDKDGADFGETLKTAQELGYAEADPTSDIEGFDAAYKAIILAAAAFGKRVTIDDIVREGITKVSSVEMEYAREFNYAIKLLAALEDGPDGVDARVHPTLLPISHPLASINGVMNAIYMEGSPIGPLMFVGRGAGADATSSAVAGDLIALAAGAAAAPGAGWNIFGPAKIVPPETIVNAFYIRMIVDDKPGVLAEIGRCLGDHGVSIASVFQKGSADGKAELVCLTHKIAEGNFNSAMEDAKKLGCVSEIASVLRVFD